MTNPPQKLNATGEPVRADQWYGRSEHLYTVAIHTSAFIGTVHIEATVVRDPQEGDWFNAIAPIVYNDEAEWFVSWDTGGTHNSVHSFKGNFTWIRARMTRPISEDEVPLWESPASLYGSVDRILLNM